VALPASLLQQPRVDILVRRIDLRVERGPTVTPPPSFGLWQGIGRCTWLRTPGSNRSGTKRLQARRISEEDKCQGLGDLFGEGVVENKRVITIFTKRYIVGALGNLVCLTLAGPFDRFQANSCQFIDDGGLLLPRAGSRCGCGEVLGGIGTL
jgi:hypothetical protein